MAWGNENVLTCSNSTIARPLPEERVTRAETIPPKTKRCICRKTAKFRRWRRRWMSPTRSIPDNKLMAERAIRTDVGAVDFLTTDITKSYRETGGGICEINAGPGLRLMHIAPSEGTPRDVTERSWTCSFHRAPRLAFPIAALTGTNGKTTCSRMLAQYPENGGPCRGQTSTDAVVIDGNVTVKGDMTGPLSANMVLRDPSVDISGTETARGGIVRSGLGYNFCDVGAVLNVTSDHLGLGGVDTLDGLAG